MTFLRMKPRHVTYKCAILQRLPFHPILILIILLPVISKVLSVILGLCDNVLDTDNIQFGFKCGIGCPDAIFALKSVINHFVARGSFICIALLDVSKAFDRVNHFKLFNYLLDVGVPIGVAEDYVIGILKCLLLYVGIIDSHMFAVKIGVRHGSTLYPSTINVFMNAYIVNLRMLDVGCHVNHKSVGCFFVCK